jgi:uncharacterized protein YdaU (DUF1376 family)
MANPDGPWVRFFASDWLAGTRGMTAAETGVYITLVATMYEHGGPIVREDARLARRCGLPTRNFAVILDRLIADEKITLEGENLWGRKVDMEVRNRSARAEKARAAALAKAERNQRPLSARAPAKQPPSSAPEVLRARGSEPEPDSEDKSSEKESSSQPSAARLWWDEFWALFPNKVGKADAVKAFDKARKRVDRQTMLDGLQRYVDKTDDRPWCNPSTWLNQDRWADQPAQQPQRQQNGISRKPTINDFLDPFINETERRENEQFHEGERAAAPAQQYAITGPRGRQD